MNTEYKDQISLEQIGLRIPSLEEYSFRKIEDPVQLSINLEEYLIKDIEIRVQH